MKILAVVNQKGGVGKTTTALSLAGAAIAQGMRTLLVDLDPHGGLSSFFRLSQEQTEHSSFDFFQPGILNPFQFKQCVINTPFEHLRLVPAAPALTTIERSASGADGMGLCLRDALTYAQADLIIVDGPPMTGILQVNALLAAEHLVIPVQTEFLAIQGLQTMMATLDLCGRQRQNVTHQITIVPTLFDRRTQASARGLTQLRERFGQKVWDGCIPVDTKFRDAMEKALLPQQIADCFGAELYGVLLCHLLDGDTQPMAGRI